MMLGPSLRPMRQEALPTTVVLKTEHTSESPAEDLFTHTFLEPISRILMGWGLGICIFTISQVMLMPLVQHPISENHWSRQC